MKLLYPSGTGVRARAYMLMEALVYIGLVVIIAGLGFAVMYRCVENSVVLRRNADDIAAAMRAGERWRADIRTAQQPPQTDVAENAALLRLSSPQGTILYRFETNTISRKVEDRAWIRLLGNVKSSAMEADQREKLTAWRWELELEPRVKGHIKAGKVRPLFTFLAVPERSYTK